MHSIHRDGVCGTAWSACRGASLTNGKIHGLSSLKLIKRCEIMDERLGDQFITVKATVHVSNVRVKFDASAWAQLGVLPRFAILASVEATISEIQVSLSISATGADMLFQELDYLKIDKVSDEFNVNVKPKNGFPDPFGLIDVIVNKAIIPLVRNKLIRDGQDKVKRLMNK